MAFRNSNKALDTATMPASNLRKKFCKQIFDDTRLISRKIYILTSLKRYFLTSPFFSHHPETTKSAKKCSRGSTSKKFITCTDWHYGMSGMALSQTSATTYIVTGTNLREISPVSIYDEVYGGKDKCAYTSKEDFLSIYNLTADYTHVYLNRLVWRRLQESWCYCVEYIIISLFWIFFAFHKVV